MPLPAPRWRPATWADRFFISRVGNQIHPLNERPAVFWQKLRLCPDGCWILTQGSRRVGYGLSHPWRLNDIPPLDRLIPDLPAKPNCLFVHDVAVEGGVRGYDSAETYLGLMESLARRLGLRHIALVAVYGTHEMWKRYGFVARTTPAIARMLQTYDDPQARYMTRAISKRSHQRSRC